MTTLSQTTHNAVSSQSFASSTKESSMNSIQKAAELAGRIFISTLFLMSGLGKIGAYAGTAEFMASLGVPSALLPIVIATEVFGAVAIILGWQTRLVALLLAGFTLLTGIVFHHDFSDQIQMIMFLKNISISGAFLLLVAHGAGPLSLDHRFTK